MSVSLVLGLGIAGGLAGPGNADDMNFGSSESTNTALPLTSGGYGFAGGAHLLTLSESDLGRELDAAKRAKATWIRMSLDWNSIETAKGSFNWTVPDRIINAARARGLKVLANPVSSPGWTRGVATFFTAPPNNNADLADFLRAFIARYGNKVTNYQIWNEPNLPIFFGLNVDAARYTSLLKAAYSAIKGAQPHATVVAAGLARSSGWNSPVNFVNTMYDNGAHGYFDALALHPYVFPGGVTANPDNAISDVGSVRTIMVAKGDSAKPIWFTEIGAATGSTPDSVSQQEQAKQITDVMSFAKSSGFVGPVLIYTIRDSGTDPNDREQNFGAIYKHDWTPKYTAGVLGAA
ncbi:glycosyl hydrolase [Gordonia aurantiaca]|uniref:glycosyl hydrolase n=1 Tax=Gordonia sp. B21 TaxID=3151852 RepID=UPI0032631708